MKYHPIVKAEIIADNEVLLSRSGYPGIKVRRGEETLPCFNTHLKEANQWVRGDVLVVGDMIAWCPCGKIYKRKKMLISYPPFHVTTSDDWQCIGNTE